MRNRTTVFLLGALILSGVVSGPSAHAARTVKGVRGQNNSGEYAALRLLKKAQDLLAAGERERGVKMLETIIEQNAKSNIRFKAHLELGRYFFEIHEQTTAINYLRVLSKLKITDEELVGDEKDMYLEALYLTGVCNFQMRQYGAAFSTLRKITSGYPNTIWANQAYYYIGMSHFAQENWSKAIKSLGLVGTFVDPDSPEVEFVEAGHRFYVKIIDGDLPILDRLGKKITVDLKTKSGDKETIVCSPLAGKADIFLGSIATEVGVAKPGDGKLQVIGGDTITTLYIDDNTKEGKKDVRRNKVVKVVSNASVKFTLGTYESSAPAAFIGQPLFVRMRDVDLDLTPTSDSATVVISSLYKEEEEEENIGAPTMTVDIDKLLKAGTEDVLQVRDEVMLTLTETGDNPVHSGIFIGHIKVEAVSESGEVNKSDNILSCAVGDEVVAVFIDKNHTSGDVPNEVVAKLVVSGEIDSTPRATQNIVSDPVVRAKKELVEAEAYLELARIFKSMGLMDGAKERSKEGLSRVAFAIRTKDPIPAGLRESAFKLKWELSLAMDDFQGAMATCKVFNRLYPESPLVDNALMGIGKVYMERKDPEEAARVFAQVLALPESHSKAEAQFLIAQIAEKGKNPERAIQQYKICAKKYPDSEYAGLALGKVIDHHIKAKDYMIADDLLEQVFMDYQDVDFLDSMLLKWVLVAYRMGNHQKAYEKASQLIFEYPGSAHAAKAKAILPKIEQKLGKN